MLFLPWCAKRHHISSCICLLSVMFWWTAEAVQVTVQPSAEECFFEPMERGEKVLCSFNVAAGGFLDIDVNVYNPEGGVVYSEERQMEGSFTFVALNKGTHKFCFGNSMSTVTAKTVQFNIYVGNALTGHGVAKQEHFSPLENAVLLLGQGLKGLEDEHQYIKVRERAHRATTESTNSRVMWWNLLQLGVLVAVAVGEVVYLRGLFEAKAKGA